eukprot:762893-Hanusia_phi.AAC.3
MEMGIYEKYLSGFSGNREALNTLNLEVDGRYGEAISHYERLLCDREQGPIADICERGMEECCAKSMKFTRLESWIRSRYEPHDDGSPPFNEKLLMPKNWKSLRNFLKSQVGQIFMEFDRFGDPGSSKVSMVKSVTASARAREEFFFEHALASFLANPTHNPECEEIVRRGITQHCESWEHSVTFGEGMKDKRVVELQRLIELDEYLLSAGDAGQLESLLRKWSRRQLKSISRRRDRGWDQILMSRYILLRHAESLNLGPDSLTLALCKKLQMQICLKLAAMAARHDNREATNAALLLAPEVSNLEYWSRQVKVAFIVASTGRDKQANDTLLRQGREQNSCFIEKMNAALSSEPEGGDENVRWRLKCLLRQGELHDSMGCQQDALACFKLAIHDSAQLSASGGMRLQYLAKAHHHLALFCDRQLKAAEAAEAAEEAEEAEEAKGSEVKAKSPKRIRIEEGKDRVISYEKEYQDMFFDSLLSAITNGFEKAKDYLPRFLEVVEKKNTKQRDGIARLFESRKFSVQPFIQWLPQIIFFHKKFSKDKLSSYLIRELSSKYPQAVYLAFQTEFGAISCAAGDLFSDIKVHFNAIDEVRKALHLLQDPFLQMIDVLKLLLKSSDSWNADERCQISDAMTDFQHQSSSNIRKALRNDHEHKELIDKMLQKRVSQADLDSAKEFQKKFSNQSLQEESLQTYSTYLSQFEGKFDDEKGMIIRYQVIGFSNLPSESSCPKLMSFDSRMIIFKSLMRPVRIAMRGSDGREHKWIVKCGEDLRQDERLQQVFGIMNRFMSSDANCSKKNLNLLTYSVVTLSKSTGILKFVEGTKPLLSFMDSSKLQSQTMEFCKSLKNMTIAKFDEIVNMMDPLTFLNSLLAGARSAKVDKS